MAGATGQVGGSPRDLVPKACSSIWGFARRLRFYEKYSNSITWYSKNRFILFCKSVKKIEKINCSLIFFVLCHRKNVFRKFTMFWRIPKFPTGISGVTSVATVRNIAGQYLLFVASEQVLDESALSEHSTRRD